MHAVIWFNFRLTVKCVIIINPSSLFWNIFSMLWCMHDCLVEAFCLILNVGESEASHTYESCTVKNTLRVIHLECVLKPTYDREENHQNHKLQVYLIVSAHPLIPIHFI